MGDEQEDDLLSAARKHGFLLRKTLISEVDGHSLSWLGGSPRLPQQYDWPYSMAHDGAPSVPLHFIAQIDLKQVPWNDTSPDMPRAGTLFFFADPIFGPAREYAGNGARVLFTSDDVSDVPMREMPWGLPEPENVQAGSYGYSEAPTRGYRRWGFTFEPFCGFNKHLFQDPDFEDPEVEEILYGLADEEKHRVFALQNSDVNKAPPPYKGGLSDAAKHSILAGASAPGRLDAYNDIVYQNDALPLLVISDDQDTGFNFGLERLVFWISPNDAKTGAFQNAWTCEGVA